MMINLRMHRFSDCGYFPDGASRKVKEKMTTQNLRDVTCEHCKSRILDSLAQRSWKELSTSEVEALDVIAVEIAEK